jgi:hypothetical protein
VPFCPFSGDSSASFYSCSPRLCCSFTLFQARLGMARHVLFWEFRWFFPLLHLMMAYLLPFALLATDKAISFSQRKKMKKNAGYGRVVILSTGLLAVAVLGRTQTVLGSTQHTWSQPSLTPRPTWTSFEFVFTTALDEKDEHSIVTAAILTPNGVAGSEASSSEAWKPNTENIVLVSLARPLPVEQCGRLKAQVGIRPSGDHWTMRMQVNGKTSAGKRFQLFKHSSVVEMGNESKDALKSWSFNATDCQVAIHESSSETSEVWGTGEPMNSCYPVTDCSLYPTTFEN